MLNQGQYPNPLHKNRSKQCLKCTKCRESLILRQLDLRTKLAEDLICFLVELELRSYQVGQVTQRFRCIEDLETTLTTIYKAKGCTYRA